MNSYYNLFVGTENGLLKGVNSHTKSFNNLNNLDNLNKDQEIVYMNWTSIIQDKICFATRNQHLVQYSTDIENQTPFEDLGQINAGDGLIKGLEFISESKFVTAVESGHIKLWSYENLEKSDLELNAGINLSCMKSSQYNTNKGPYLIASGGKENDLKIWDINQLSGDKKEPIFRAKNLPDNWMQLRQPIWIMGIDFLDADRVIVSTAFHQVKIYDIKSGIRRPVLHFNYGEHPITSIAALSNDSNRVIIGNSIGEMEMIDLRSSNTKNLTVNSLKKYKNFQGTIKSMQITNQHVATCGLDRFLRVHNIETSELVSKVYLKSRLNCLLFSKHLPIKPPNTYTKKIKGEIEEDQLSNINSEDLGTDDLWSDMEQIIEEHPALENKKRKNLTERLNDFESEYDATNEECKFKKPK